MARPARILHCHSTFMLGGKEARAVRLMNAFGDAAVHVVLSAVPGALAARAAIDPGIDVDFPGAAAPPLQGRPGWRRYAELPFEGGGFTPDLILVDGRFRVACALVTTRELRHLPGTTLLIDDYAGRPHYHEVERFAELLAMHGRMAECAMRPHVDRAALDRSSEQHARDWR